MVGGSRAQDHGDQGAARVCHLRAQHRDVDRRCRALALALHEVPGCESNLTRTRPTPCLEPLTAHVVSPHVHTVAACRARSGSAWRTRARASRSSTSRTRTSSSRSRTRRTTTGLRTQPRARGKRKRRRQGQRREVRRRVAPSSVFLDNYIFSRASPFTITTITHSARALGRRDANDATDRSQLPLWEPEETHLQEPSPWHQRDVRRLCGCGRGSIAASR